MKTRRPSLYGRQMAISSSIRARILNLFTPKPGRSCPKPLRNGFPCREWPTCSSIWRHRHRREPKIFISPRASLRHSCIMGKRREARERAVQFLFQHDLNPPEDLQAALEHFWETQRAAAIAEEKGTADSRRVGTSRPSG